ncbi:flagellar hook-length control protein FliK [Wukongibacter sp. M2B1]|uniref:flagellar hook-length control protein FliK n=1 Tax=Wukongibacter sp. M2B1 TaxID=3088895 RepID=UPI003D79B496
MTNRDIIQSRMFQRTVFSNNQSLQSSKSQQAKDTDEDFSKVLSDKNKEKRTPEKSTVEPCDKKEEAKSLKDSEVRKTKETDTLEDEISKVEETTDESKDLDALNEEETLNELTSLIEDLIHTLQLNDIVDKDKLQEIISDFEKSDLSFDDLKGIVNDLELIITKDIANIDISDKLVKIGQLFETLDAETVSSLSNIPKELADSSKSVNVEENSEKDMVDKDLSINEEKATSVKNVEESSMGNIKESPEKDLEGKSEKNTEEINEKKSGTIDSADSTDKGKELLAIKKDANEGTTKQNDFILSGMENIKSDEFKGVEISSIDKPLENAVKADMKIFNQIIEGAKINISEDVSEMLIKMKPDNLGKLSMKIVVDRGMLVARFEVESQIVKETIESNLEDLRNALKDKGFEIQQFDVSVNKDSQNSENHFSYFNKGKSRKMSIKNEAFSNDTYTASQQTIDGLTSTINYLG